MSGHIVVGYTATEAGEDAVALGARLAAASGVGVLVTSSELVAEALSGAEIGTWFEPSPDGRPTRTIGRLGE